MRSRWVLLLLFFPFVSCGSPPPIVPPPAEVPWTPFNDPLNRPHPERRHDYDVLHYRFRIELDETPRKTEGRAEISFASDAERLESLDLDASDMTIRKVEDGEGSALTFTHDDPSLRIVLSKPLARGERSVVRIDWTGTPRQGLTWVVPDPQHPDRPFQIWSQGETEYTHTWLPCYDYPNDKATAEMIVTVPAKYSAISNGVLVERKADEKRATYHWKEETPFVSYLITCVVGDFEETADAFKTESREIPVTYHVSRGKFTEEEVRWSFGKTPDMMKFFSDNTGVTYPYGKYAQIAVWDFTWGGMENVTATTLYQWVVTPKPLWPDQDKEGLIAHELAHQWFGDLVTCRSWEHLWLNEGFASYFEALWREHAYGKDDLARVLDGERDWHLGERKQYDRPVVTNVYTEPDDLFDSFIYAKGAWVLHMLRDVVGETAWWKGISEYVKRHRGQCVTTEDFRRVMEEAYGRPLDWFFDQWLDQTGIPEFRLTKHWDADHKTLRLIVEQTQETGERVPIFRVPVDVEVKTVTRADTYRIWCVERQQDYYFALDSEPLLVRFDRDEKILKTLDFRPSVREWVFQLRSGSNAVSRVRAAEELAKLGDPQKRTERFGEVSDQDRTNAIAALGKTLQEDESFWVRQKAARALGEIREVAARDALTVAAKIENPKVRCEVLFALGGWASEEPVQNALREAVSGDSSWICRQKAATAFGKAGMGAYEFLARELAAQAENSWVATGLLEGLGNTEDARTLDDFKGQLAAGRPVHVRRTAAAQIAKVGKKRDDVLEILMRLLDDPEYRLVGAVIEAMSALENPKGAEPLRRFAERATDGRLRKDARAAADALEKKAREAKSEGN